MVKTHQKTRFRTDIIPGLSYPGCHPADGTYISRFNIAGTASAWNLQSTSSSPFEAIDQSFRGDSLQLWNIDFSDLKYAGPCTASAALLQHNCLRITYSMALQLQSVIDPSTSLIETITLLEIVLRQYLVQMQMNGLNLEVLPLLETLRTRVHTGANLLDKSKLPHSLMPWQTRISPAYLPHITSSCDGISTGVRKVGKPTKDYVPPSFT